jgi:anti-sigma-K factor RskA
MVAIPATFLGVALIILMAWLAARASSRQQQLDVLQKEYAATQKTLEAAQKQVVGLQSDLETARDPGRTTVVLQAPAGKAVARGAKPGAAAAWAAATWGETTGKSWIRLSAYGVTAPAQGQAIKVWFEPRQGSPIELGRLDPSQAGTALVEAKGLPEVDQGKRILASIEPEAAKAPGSNVLFEANLPKLEPVTKAAPAAPETGSAKMEIQETPSASAKAAPAQPAK